MIVGTSHFVSLEAAIRYYREYDLDSAEVARKIADGEIHIGAPELLMGQKLIKIDNGLRYGLEGEDE